MRTVLGRDPGPVEATSIATPIVSATAGLWRVRAEGISLVLKLLRHSTHGHPQWLSGEDPSHWYSWRREAMVYRSGLLGQLSGGLRAPACHVVDRDDGSVALWLEDLGAPAAWPLARYRLAAEHLGRAQAGLQPPPSHDWLSRDWLRAYVRRRGAAVDERLFDELAALPRALCHLDVHPANLFDDRGRTVLVDWAFAGVGAITEDAGNLVPDAVLDFHVPPSDLDRLFDAVLDGFCRGLRKGGMDLSRQRVRRGMLAVAALKYAWIRPAVAEAEAAGRAELNRRPLREAAPVWRAVADWLETTAKAGP